MLRSFLARTGQWWKAKAGFLISLLLFNLAVHQVPVVQGAMLMVLAFVAILGLGTLGHVINDWTDIEEDRKAGKRNTLVNVSTWGRWIILLVSLGLAFLPWLMGFASNELILSLVLAEVALFLLYSVKPFRLKRFPHVAIFVDAIYAYVNTALFLWLSFESTLQVHSQPLVLFLLIAWTLPLGLRHILEHHISDKENDLRSNTPNLAVHIGVARIIALIRILVFVEVCAMVAFFFSMTDSALTISIVLLVIYLFLVLTHLTARFPFVRIHLGELAFDRFYVTGIGLVSLAYLAYGQLFYLLGVPVFLLFFSNFFRHPLQHILFDNVRTKGAKIIKLPFQLASLGFNWSLYYFRKWILQWPEARNWGTHYQKHIQEKRLDEKGNIAIFNQNYDKYSETFISKQLHALDYRTFFYYGWPKPLTEREKGNLISDHAFVRKLYYFWLHLLNKKVSDQEDGLIAESLIGKDVKLIVAHFGPMGVSLLNVSKKSGIPLIVIFHGYDAWNKAQLKEHEAGYQMLFGHASCVIGVSQDICDQLKKLGCPPEKIQHQPAYLDLELFEKRSPVTEGNNFLYVGRFSKTKAPMQVILAFSDVLKKMPDATMVMVGGDDGEGLYEACIMLVKMLGIESSVQFKGMISAEEVQVEMTKASVFVQHSVTTPILGDKEGTPVGIMEAMAIGLPIVATHHAGIAEIIESGRTGMLVDEYDVSAMAAAMVQLAADPDLRRMLGQNAATAIRENELISRSLEKFSEIIDRHKLR